MSPRPAPADARSPISNPDWSDCGCPRSAPRHGRSCSPRRPNAWHRRRPSGSSSSWRSHRATHRTHATGRRTRRSPSSRPSTTSSTSASPRSDAPATTTCRRSTGWYGPTTCASSDPPGPARPTASSRSVGPRSKPDKVRCSPTPDRAQFRSGPRAPMTTPMNTVPSSRVDGWSDPVAVRRKLETWWKSSRRDVRRRALAEADVTLTDWLAQMLIRAGLPLEVNPGIGDRSLIGQFVTPDPVLEFFSEKRVQPARRVVAVLAALTVSSGSQEVRAPQSRRWRRWA